MADLTALPADITPVAFFGLLQEALADEAVPASDDTTVVHLDGEGGGAWTGHTIDERIQFTSGVSAAPALQISMTVDDWRSAVAGAFRDRLKAEAGDAAPNPAGLGKALANPAINEKLKVLEGDLKLVITDGDSTHAVTATFGGTTPNTAEPTTTITVSLDDLLAMASGAENPQAAFFAGKIELDGDMALAMGLMTLAV